MLRILRVHHLLALNHGHQAFTAEAEAALEGLAQNSHYNVQVGHACKMGPESVVLFPT